MHTTVSSGSALLPAAPPYRAGIGRDAFNTGSMDQHAAARRLAGMLLLGTAVMDTPSAALTAEVKKMPAGPVLHIDGEAVAPAMFFVNLTAPDRGVYGPVRLGEIKTAGKHGVNILSIELIMPWQRDGFDAGFESAGALIRAALAQNPNALIIPRIGMTWPPRWWSDEHPDEMMLYGDSSRGIASVHSRVWRKAAAKNLAAFIEHLEREFGDHILGYHPTGQNTGEWFYDRVWDGALAGFEQPALTAFRDYLKRKYTTEAVLRRAWRSPGVTFDDVAVPSLRERTTSKGEAVQQADFRDPALEQKTIDFFEFQSHEMATAAEELCQVIRSKAPGKLAVLFYGYPFELSALPHGPQVSGHLAMSHLLESPHVDVLCSPVSYQNRAPGGGGFFMSAVDSVQRAGKLWLVEDDTRTSFSDPDAGFGRCSTMEETRAVLARNFGHYATRGGAAWWMDLPGQGWYQGDELWGFLGRLREVYRDTLGRLEPYRPEIAAVIDEKSCLYIRPGRGLSQPLIGAFREQWYRIGAPVGVYLLDDLVSGKAPPARIYIVLNAFSLSQEQAVALRRNICRRGNVVVWMYAPGIIREGKLDARYVQELTGMRLEICSAPGEIVVSRDGETFSAGHQALSPMFRVNEQDAEVLATYSSGGTAVAAKADGGCLSVYSGVLQLPASLLRNLAIRAGAHIYSESGDIVAAGNGLVAIHASSDGPRTIRLPSPGDVTDAVTGENLGRASAFTFRMAAGDTRLLAVRSEVKEIRNGRRTSADKTRIPVDADASSAPASGGMD